MSVQIYDTIFGRFSVYRNDIAFVEEFKRGNVWEHNIVKKVLEILPNNGTILDIGAHIGTHCIPYALSHPNLDIISFEPQTNIRELLEKNIISLYFNKNGIYASSYWMDNWKVWKDLVKKHDEKVLK
jgi:tRNA G46 methylase TrmB